MISVMIGILAVLVAIPAVYFFMAGFFKALDQLEIWFNVFGFRDHLVDERERKLITKRRNELHKAVEVNLKDL